MFVILMVRCLFMLPLFWNLMELSFSPSYSPFTCFPSHFHHFDHFLSSLPPSFPLILSLFLPLSAPNLVGVERTQSGEHAKCHSKFTFFVFPNLRPHSCLWISPLWLSSTGRSSLQLLSKFGNFWKSGLFKDLFLDFT